MNIAFDVELTKMSLIGTYTVVLAVHGLLNTFGVRLVAIFNNMSVWWHVAGVAVIFAMLFIVPDSAHELRDDLQLQPGADRRVKSPGFINGTGFDEPASSASPSYVFLIGLLLAQYTLTGYDASAHMTEETHEADVAGPKGIWKSVVISVFFGYILLLGGVVRDAGPGGLRRGRRVPDSTRPATSRRRPQIFLDACRQELGDLHADHRRWARSSSAAWRPSRRTRA